jgi:alpha-galactosidase
MAMEAAVRGDVTLLKQAMLHDPLVGAVCNPEEVWQMTDEMLVAQERWLPQYAAEIPRGAAAIWPITNATARAFACVTRRVPRGCGRNPSKKCPVTPPTPAPMPRRRTRGR